MSKENLHAPKDQIWKQYRFVFQNANTVNGQLSASIREMIASLDLQKEMLDIRYEEAGKDPLMVDVYIEERADMYAVTSLLKPHNERIFPKSGRSLNAQGLVSAKATAAANTDSMTGTSATLDAAFTSEDDDTTVSTVTFRGAVPNPPPPAEPLP